MKELVFRHFEKGVLAVSLVFLVAAAKPLLARPGELDAREAVVALDARVNQHLDTYSPELPPVPDNLTPLRASVAAFDPLEPFGPWLTHRRPSLVYDIQKPPPPPPCFHVAPRLEVAVAHGSVTLTWGPGDGNDSVVTGYRLERTDAKGVTVVLANQKEVGTLVDSAAEARATYTYTLVETAEAPPARAPLEAKDVALSLAKSATLPRELVVHPSRHAVNDPVTGVPNDVKLYVHRWKDGKWVRKEVQGAKVGDKIGKKDGREDFSTGAELLEITHDAGVTSIRIKWASGLIETLKSTDTYDGIAKPGD